MSRSPLLNRISAGESRTTEFKSDAESKDIGKVVCSFLNTEGGAVFCGVSDDGRISGLDGDAETVARRLELELKRAISPTPFLTADVVELDDVRIVLVEVPRGLDGPYVFEGAVWLRRGDRTRAADVSELRALLRSDSSSERWERQLSPAMSSEHLDQDELRNTVEKVRERRAFAFSNPSDGHLVLKELGLLASSGYTQAGDVLFSRDPALRHPQCRAQLLVFPGQKSDARYDNNRLFEGPLVRVCQELISAVWASNSVRSTFHSDSARRTDQAAYDPSAIREGIVNAFVHRDYSAYSGGLKVTVYADRIEIWNSGSLPGGLRPSDLRRDHPSILVNPDISQVFYIRGFMERIGRGTEFIAKASKRLNAPAPQWRDAPTGVTLTIHSAHGVDHSNRPLNERQVSLLNALTSGESVSLRDYASRFGQGITERQARRDMEGLVRSGVLVVEGAGPSTTYKRT